VGRLVLSEPSEFKAFEAAGWSERAASYDRLSGQLTARLQEPLLNAAEVGEGVRLLDVASGTGELAAAASARGATAVGVDLAEGMLEEARSRHPGLEFRHADAEALPFGDGEFDAVTASFLYNHLERPERATAEAARVLRPGGRFALCVWDVPEHMRVIGLVNEAVQVVGVPETGVPPAGPDPYRFADDGEMRALLEGAGLSDVRVGTETFELRVQLPGELWDGILESTVRTAAIVEAMEPEDRDRAREHFERLAMRYREAGDFAIPVSAKLGAARKPE
jgi:SAM-dependent methyltransferase